MPTGNKQRIAYNVERRAYRKRLSAKRYPLNAKQGFTLIELLVAVAVLSLGLVLMYEAFFSYMDAFNYSYRRLEAQRWIDEKIWSVEDELVRSGILLPGELTGSFSKDEKVFNWVMSIQTLGEIEDSFLYIVRLSVNWSEITRNVRVSQVAYVQN